MTTPFTTQSSKEEHGAGKAAIHDLMTEILHIVAEFDHETRRRTLRARAERGQALGPTHYGYRRIHATHGSRRVRVVEPDPRTSLLVIWAFETFARSQLTITQLHAALQDHALKRYSAPRPAVPSYSRLRAILRDPFYTGVVRFENETYPGAHEPLISRETFERVQERFAAAGRSRETNHV